MSSTGTLDPAALYGVPAQPTRTRFWLRCHQCDRLLAEALSAPYRIRCRCGALNQADPHLLPAYPREARRR